MCLRFKFGTQGASVFSFFSKKVKITGLTWGITTVYILYSTVYPVWHGAGEELSR
jgi:hypothetical protein